MKTKILYYKFLRLLIAKPHFLWALSILITLMIHVHFINIVNAEMDIHLFEKHSTGCYSYRTPLDVVYYFDPHGELIERFQSTEEYYNATKVYFQSIQEYDNALKNYDSISRILSSPLDGNDTYESVQPTYPDYKDFTKTIQEFTKRLQDHHTEESLVRMSLNFVNNTLPSEIWLEIEKLEIYITHFKNTTTQELVLSETENIVPPLLLYCIPLLLLFYFLI